MGSKRVCLDSLGMVSNWLWYFRRTDAFLRNEWSNYTNWPYDHLPYNVIDPNDNLTVLSDYLNTFHTEVNINFIESVPDKYKELLRYAGLFLHQGNLINNYPFYANQHGLFLYVYADENKGWTWAFTDDINNLSEDNILKLDYN